MAAIVSLTALQRTELITLLNNLNLGFAQTRFGQIFVALIDGTPQQIAEPGRSELKALINDLNLGFAHIKAGDIIVELMAKNTGAATAKALTVDQTDALARLFQNLNLGLAKLNIGELIKAAVKTLASGTGTGTGTGTTPTPTPTKAVAKKADVSGKKVGDKVDTTDLFTLSGGAAEADLTLTVSPTASGTVSTDKKTIEVKAAGTITVKAKIGTGTEVSATITATAATPPAPKTITGKGDVTGKTGGTEVDYADLFTPSNGAALSDVASVSGTNVTDDNAGKKIKLADAAAGDITLTFTVGSGITKAGTVVLKAVTAKVTP
ncbi:hypothetical protein E0G74_01035 [Salmonella enterica]|nr:hypothetical protein [Salmonella enterica]